MLNFTSSLNDSSGAFGIFVTGKYDYEDKARILSQEQVKKIDSFLRILKEKNKDDEIASFDISSKKKCFVIKIKNKPESYFYEEVGGKFFSYIKTHTRVYFST